jgi:aminoglycoside phosphotransferase (APT) family kinase protein
VSSDAITAEALRKAGVADWFPGATGIERLQQLSGGASQETWSFDVVHPSGNIGAILRRAPAGYGAAPTRAAGLEVEAALMQRAYEARIPSPRVRHVLREQDGLGRGFIMDRVAG